MPCPHKFQQYLNLERLDFEPTTLMVGTFNPEWPSNNYAEWFYGRVANNSFWDVLPRIYNERSLIDRRANDWKSFCKDKRLAITDIIAGIEDADINNSDHISWLKGYSDKKVAENFQKHSFTDIVKILKNHPSIDNVYLTRQAKETFWKKAWHPIKHHAKFKNIHEEELITPSGYAFYQHGRFNNQNPQNKIPLLQDFILMRWKEKWHKLN